MMPPNKLGLTTFDQWRGYQPEAILSIVEAFDTYGAAILGPPVGVGKSLIEEAIAPVMRRGGWNGRTLTLVSTRGLQDQMNKDFKHLEDIRGRGNYQCVQTRSTCATGGDYGCEDGRCPYTLRKLTCTARPDVISNYAWKSAVSMYPNAGIGNFDLTIMDEAHEIPEEITRAVGVELAEREQYRVLVDVYGDGKKKVTGGGMSWRLVAEKWIAGYDKAYIRETASGEEEDTAPMEEKKLKQKMAKFAKWDGHENWLTYSRQGSGDVRLDIIRPAMFAKSMLFPSGKVLLTTATPTSRTASDVGIKKEDCFVRPWPPVFDPARWPMTWIRTTRVVKDWRESDELDWIRAIDKIIGTRAVALNRNGIIHAVSYPRAMRIKQLSKFANRITVPNSLTTRSEVEKFKANPCQGRVLVSPSIDTGYSFDGDAARWMILAKVPYLPVKDPLTVARREKDRRYSDAQTGQTMSQMVGRLMRGEEDWCEIFCIDDMIKFYMDKNRDLVTEWFPLFDKRGRMRVGEVLPPPMVIG